MNWKTTIAALTLLASFGSASLAQDADKDHKAAPKREKMASKTVKHDSAWRAKHETHNSAWRARHRKHSASWYAKHNKHDAAWYAKHRKSSKKSD